MHTTENLSEFQAMQWCFKVNFGIKIRLQDTQNLRKCLALIKKNNDWLSATYWNEFVKAHNKQVNKEDFLPSFEIPESMPAQQNELIH